jgi:hypothetical protein
MATGDTLGAWSADANHPPLTAFATPDTRNGHPVLDFDGTTDEEACFTGVMPHHYGGGSIAVRLLVGMTSATSGAARWQTDFERILSGTLDVDADSFSGTFQSAGLTIPGTAGVFTWVTITHTNAQIDGLVAGDAFRLKVRRDADGTSGTDDQTTDAELLAVELQEA